MASRLNPYLNFGGNAREALEFYEAVFGGSLSLATFGDFGEGDAGSADQIMHGTLETSSGFTIMAADTPPGEEFRPGTNMAVMVSGDDVEELRGYWQQLSDGATVTVPLERQVWGDEFGMCIDRFGVPWMVNISSPQD